MPQYCPSFASLSLFNLFLLVLTLDLLAENWWLLASSVSISSAAVTSSERPREASPNCRIGELRDAKAFPPTCLTCQTNVRRKSKTGKVKILAPAIFPGKIVPFVMQKCFQGLFTFDWVVHRRMHCACDRLLQMMESARKSKHWSAVGLINHNHIFESSFISLQI